MMIKMKMNKHMKNNIRHYATHSGVPIPLHYLASKRNKFALHLEAEKLISPYTFANSIDFTLFNELGGYTIFILMRHDRNQYKMCGEQFGYDIHTERDIYDLYHIVLNKINNALDNYSLSLKHIDFIRINFVKVDTKFINEFQKDAVQQLNESGFSKSAELLNMPSNQVINQLEDTLLVETTENNIISKISLVIDNKPVNFMDLVKKANRLSPKNREFVAELDGSYNFYYVREREGYILGTKRVNDNTAINIKFSLKGIILNRVVETLLDDGMTKRTRGNLTTYTKGDKVIFTENTIELTNIDIPKQKRLFVQDPNLGVIDLETFTDDDNVNKVYSAGLYCNLMDKPVTFYVGPDYNFDQVVLDLIAELLKGKYSNVMFYAHNLGGYDVVFILSVLSKYSYLYSVDVIAREFNIMELTIRPRWTKNRYKVVLRDSMNMLSGGLRQLGIDFEVESQKTYFPYNFVSRGKLFYKDVIPPISEFKGISPDTYASMYTTTWDLKEASISYLEQDLKTLYEVISRANKRLFLDYNVNFRDSITIAGLAFKIFRKRYYDGNIPKISKQSVYLDIKSAYFGGMTEVYKPSGQNLYYYDVNSLYPFVGFQDLPGDKCSKVSYNNIDVNIKNLFGFFDCEVESPEDLYLGLLPVRDQYGVKFPKGKWRGMYFSEELKFAQENGYKIKVLNGYVFNRVSNIFESYIKDVYKNKSTAINKTQKTVAKSLLNNLLGRFGIGLDKAISKIVDRESFNKIMLMYPIKSWHDLGGDNIFVNYIPRLDKDIIESHNLDLVKLADSNKDFELTTGFNIGSIGISAAITAYGRIHISRLKLDILKQGGSLYYSDTDSIVTDKCLDDTYVGTEIGKLKLEHEVKHGIFITGKTYGLLLHNNDYVKAAKGVKVSGMTPEHYMNLYGGTDVVTSKSSSTKKWDTGDVSIESLNIKLSADVYQKRIKVYCNNKWVDTVPITINGIDKGLIVRESRPMVIWTKPDSYFILLTGGGGGLQTALANADPFNRSSKDISGNLGNNGVIKSSIKGLHTIGLYMILIVSILAYYITQQDSTESLETDVESHIIDDKSSDGISNEQPNVNKFSMDLRPWASKNIYNVSETSSDIPLSVDLVNTDCIDPNKATIAELAKEAVVLNAISDNITAKHLNSLISVNPNAEIKVMSQEHIELIRSISNRVGDGCEVSMDDIQRVSPTDSEFSNIVKQIREGYELNILTPKTASSHSEADTSDQVNTKPTSMQDKITDEAKVDMNPKFAPKKSIIIVSKPVKEGDSIPALPSWTDSMYDSSRTRVVKKMARKAFYDEFVSTHTDHTKPSTKNQDWMESSDDLGVSTLFEGNSSNNRKKGLVKEDTLGKIYDMYSNEEEN